VRFQGDIRVCLGCILCQKRLRSSWTVEECKPLNAGRYYDLYLAALNDEVARG
jgi:hypothetical protein